MISIRKTATMMTFDDDDDGDICLMGKRWPGNPAVRQSETSHGTLDRSPNQNHKYLF